MRDGLHLIAMLLAVEASPGHLRKDDAFEKVARTKLGYRGVQYLGR